jgi:hypothetical protein
MLATRATGTMEKTEAKGKSWYGRGFLAVVLSPTIAKSIMITQQEFVADCYLDYAARGLEPGNPEHGRWNKCHYPVPKCLGGTEWIWLLEEHHAIQGILQSEEYNVKCFYGYWEEKYLTGEWEWVREIWMNQMIKQAKLMRAGYSQWVQDNPGIKSQIMINAWERWKKDPEAVRNRCKFGGKAGAKWVEDNPELASERGQKAAAVTNCIKYKCTVTGHVSTAGPLSIYQRKRGIDTSNRIRLN